MELYIGMRYSLAIFAIFSSLAATHCNTLWLKQTAPYCITLQYTIRILQYTVLHHNTTLQYTAIHCIFDLCWLVLLETVL